MIPTEPGYYWAIKAGEDTSSAERSVVQVYRWRETLWVRHHGHDHPPNDYLFLAGPLPPPGDAPASDGGSSERMEARTMIPTEPGYYFPRSCAPGEITASRTMTPTEPGYYWAIRSNDKTSEPERIIVRVERADTTPTQYLEVQIGKSTYPLDHFCFLSGPLKPPPLTPDGEKAGSPPDPTRDDDQFRQLAALLGRTEAIITRSEALADRAQGMEGDKGTADDLAARVRHLETSRQAFRAVNESLNRRLDALEAKSVRDMNDAISKQGDMEGWEETIRNIEDRLYKSFEELEQELADKFAPLNERLRVLEEIRQTQDDINAKIRDMLLRAAHQDQGDRCPDMAGGALGERIDELARRLATREEVDANILRTLDRLEGRTKYLQGWAETIRIMEDRLKQLIEHMREFGRWSDAAEETKK